MADLGLPFHGDKRVLEARHKQFRNMYNANLDRDHPKSQSELLRDLLRWEEQMSSVNTNGFQSTTGHQKTEIDEMKKQIWASKHKDQFAELIEATKKRKTERQATEYSLQNQSGTAIQLEEIQETALLRKEILNESNISIGQSVKALDCDCKLYGNEFTEIDIIKTLHAGQSSTGTKLEHPIKRDTFNIENSLEHLDTNSDPEYYDNNLSQYSFDIAHFADTANKGSTYSSYSQSLQQSNGQQDSIQ
ncbi:E3 ubiquitin-protein ligase rad18 [Nowakowskiella sp. JEL0078]|nr:E3 ubiquitin-protein ligase rad18 [Nowakowskiella sp. JEL0078]